MKATDCFSSFTHEKLDISISLQERLLLSPTPTDSPLPIFNKVNKPYKGPLGFTFDKEGYCCKEDSCWPVTNCLLQFKQFLLILKQCLVLHFLRTTLCQLSHATSKLTIQLPMCNLVSRQVHPLDSLRTVCVRRSTDSARRYFQLRRTTLHALGFYFCFFFFRCCSFLWNCCHTMTWQ